MIAALRRRLWPALILILGLAARADAQCVSDTWTLEAATGDVAEIETSGEVAWIAADGGVIRIDLATLGQTNPDQQKITDSEGLISSDVSCMTIDGFGNVYVGTRESGISVFDAAGRHLTNLTSFDEFVWSDRVVALQSAGDTGATYTVQEEDGPRTIVGDRIVASSADSFSPTGTLEGGGMKAFYVEQEPDGTFRFTREPGIGIPVQLVREIFLEPGVIWAGTSGRGVWKRDETVSPPTVEQVLSAGLRSTTIKEILRGPNLDGSPGSALWIGTGDGLQTWDETTLREFSFFNGHNILDLHLGTDEMYILSEDKAVPSNLVRDLYRVNLTQQPLVPERLARSDCLADTLYIPRRIALDSAGRIVLGTREDSFTVQSSGVWECAPPLGPHSPTIADLTLSPDGTLYFGTGDKNRIARANGLGWFDGSGWRSLTPSDDPEMLEINTTEVVVWPDSTVWFGSTRNANFGGLNRLFPATGALEKYHDDVVDVSRLTLGRNVWGLELDQQNNLWVVYGQGAGGLSIIEYPSLQITNIPLGPIFAQTTLLRDIAFDTRGRAWVTTTSDPANPGQLYVIDTKGTYNDQSDDTYTAFNVANEIADIAPIPFIAIDDTDQVWLAGQKGLVVGQIGADAGGRATATWQVVSGTNAQLGGRNPLPYVTGHLDWDNNLWLGTEASGLVRISKDLSEWTWVDELSGCPLPDQSITGLHIDDQARVVYVGTATGGIATIDMASVISLNPGRLDPLPFPNPYRPASDGFLNFSGIPAAETVGLKIYNVAGELIHEADGLRGAKTWDGRNLGAQVVEAGLYLVVATTRDGDVYEGKVAVIR